MKHQIFLLLNIVLLMSSCDNGQLSPIELVKYTEDPTNGLRIEKQSKDFKLQAQYKPLDYIVAMEERKPSLQHDIVEKRRSELGEEMDYFNFRISPAKNGKDTWSYIKEAKDEQTRNEMSYYLSYEAKKDFYLLDGSDTLDCKLFQYMNTSGLSPHIDFLLGFEKRPASDRLLVYNDQVLDTGPVEFKIEKKNINNIPALKTK